MASKIQTIVSYVPKLALRRRLADPAPPRAAEIESHEAAVLLIDVSGFTKLTEMLAQRGPEGAEAMTQALNAYFGELIERVHFHGGDIVKFAGDAMLVLFTDTGLGLDLRELTRRATQCALVMQRECGTVHPLPDVTLQFKAIIGAGEMRTAHVGGVYGRWEFVVMGKPLADMTPAAIQAEAGDVILSAEAWDLIKDEARGQAADAGAVRVFAIEAAPDLMAVLDLPPPAEFEASLKAFLPGAVRARLDAGQMSWLAELRSLTVLFVNLPGLNHETPLETAQAIMHTLQTAVYRYEGSINKMSVDEKGISMVAAMGLPPLSHYDDPARGIGAALLIQQKLKEMGLKCSIGVTTGRAFCGEVGNARRREYTMMGDVVNLSARLMSAAKQHGILADATTFKAAESTYEFEELEAIPIKGKTGLFQIFKPRGKTAHRATSDVTLVGRTNERSAIAQHLERLKERKEGGRILIEGDAGIGKSALVGYAAAQASALSIRVLEGAGDEVEKNTPYIAWHPVLNVLFGFEEGTGAAAKRQKIEERLAHTPETAQRAPLMGAIYPVNIPDNEFTAPLEGPVRAQYLHDLVARLIQEEAEKSPLLLIMDDCHWLDSASWALAQAVSKKVDPVLLLLAARPLGSPLPPEVTAVVGTAPTHFDIPPMTADEAFTLVSRRLGVASLPDEIATLIQERAGGHPLFIEELGYSLRDSGHLVIEGDLCYLSPEAGDLKKLDLPTTVQGTIMSRIDRLSPAEQLTLKLASVVGRVFDHKILADIHPIEGDKGLVRHHLDSLMKQDLTRHGASSEARESDLQQAFKSATTREVAYNLMLFAQRKSVHKSVAEWYENVFSTDLAPHLAFLAHHWSSANIAEKAVEYLDQAGQIAERSYAYKEAAEFLSAALEFDSKLEQGSDPRRRLKFHQWLGKVYKGMGRQDESQQHLDQALELARELGDVETEAKALTSLAHLHSIRNEADKALELFDQAEARALEAKDGNEYCRATQLHARVWLRKGDPVKAIALCQSAIDLARDWPEPLDTSLNLALLGTMHVASEVPGLDTGARLRRGIEYLNAGVAALRKAGNRLDLNNSLNLLGNAQWILGRFTDARKTFEETLTLTSEMGIRYDEICALINLAIQAHELGDFREMARLAHKAHAEATASGYSDYGLIALVLRSVAQAYLGKPAESIRLHEQAMQELGGMPEGTQQALEMTILPYLAERQLFCGQTAEGLATAQKAWKQVEETNVREYEQRLLTLRGDALARVGRLDEAAACHRQALELGEAAGAMATVARAQEGLAEIAQQRGDLESAHRLLKDAYEAAATLETRFLAGEIALLRGRVSLSSGLPHVAGEWFERAVQWGQDASCPHLVVMGQYGLACVFDGSDAQHKLTAAQALLKAQVEGLDVALAEGYCSLGDRGAIRLGALPGGVSQN